MYMTLDDLPSNLRHDLQMSWTTFLATIMVMTLKCLWMTFLTILGMTLKMTLTLSDDLGCDLTLSYPLPHNIFCPSLPLYILSSSFYASFENIDSQ